MISASKTTFDHYNFKILRLKVTINLTNLLKKFCEFWPCLFYIKWFFLLPDKQMLFCDSSYLWKRLISSSNNRNVRVGNKENRSLTKFESPWVTRALSIWQKIEEFTAMSDFYQTFFCCKDLIDFPVSAGVCFQ
jgi:hypothetical protein